MQLAAAPACGGGAVWGAEEGGGGQGRGGEGVLGQEQRGLLVYLGGEKKMNLMEAKKKINLMKGKHIQTENIYICCPRDWRLCIMVA